MIGRNEALRVGAVGERRLDLDWVRISAFALLILYHVGMFYVPWSWHVKSPHPVAALEPLMVLTNPWRLPLLFLISGVATRYMADASTTGALLRRRMARLLPPLVFGMLVVVPPQTYVQITHSLHQAIGASAFYARYVTASGGWIDPVTGPLLTPTWNHLWFVAYLLVYSVLLCGALALARPHLGRMQRAVERVMSAPWALVLIPMAGAVFTKLVVSPRFPDTHALVGDWNVHAESALPFLFGFLLARAEPVWSAMVRARWAGFVGGTVGYVVYALIVALVPDRGTEAIRAVAGTAYAVEQWGLIVAILGFAHLHLAARCDGPVRRYLTDAIFPFYIIHQTIIVLAAPWLASYELPQALEAAVLISITAGGCVLTYEIARRSGPLRPLFGLSRRARASRVGPRAAGPQTSRGEVEGRTPLNGRC